MQVKFKGTPVNTIGTLPGSYDQLPDFTLVNRELKNIGLADIKTSTILLNIFPSLDTSTCAQSVRTFNLETASLKDITVLCISADLPFAQSRFCSAEDITNVIMLSSFRSSFGKDYGIGMVDGPLKQLLARAVFIADKKRKIIYTQLVSEITEEPDYRAALKILKHEP